MHQSLQCPQCNGVVAISDAERGTRVRCPHCEKTFLAPGTKSSGNDDDDWLSLDDKSPADRVPPSAEASTSVPPPSAPPKLSADDEAALSEFTAMVGDDLDEFTASDESLPPKPTGNQGVTDAASSVSDGNDQWMDDLPAITPPPVPGNPPPKPDPPRAESIEYASEYRVTCPTCGSLLYAKATQAGKKIKCSDCYSAITVPPPPRVRKKVTMDIENAPTFQLESTTVDKRREDPFRKSAAELLKEAEQVDEDSGPDDFETPQIGQWAMNVFGIFMDIGVLFHWFAISLFAAIPTYIALKIENPILVLGLFPGGLFLSGVVVACGFTILQSVANDEKTVSDWPTFDPPGMFGQSVVALAAAGFCGVPVFVLCQLVTGNGLLTIALTMLSIYVMFPFVLLSMLDMQSIFVPFSPEVARSVNKCQEAWGGFYFSAGLIFLGLFLVFVAASTMDPPVAAVISIFAAVGTTFAYFSLIGRLAYAIGQAVNAPPAENDIDQTRKKGPISGP